MRVNNWRMRPFGPLSWTFTEVPRENAIAVGAFVAIRQVGPTRHVGGGDRTSALTLTEGAAEVSPPFVKPTMKPRRFR